MKLRKIPILLLIILFAVLQATLLNSIQIFNIKPDSLIILIIFFSLYYGPSYGLIIGALSGFFSEATSNIPAGIFVFSYSLTGLILGQIGRWVYPRENILGQVAVAFIVTCTTYLLVFFILLSVNIKLPLFNTLAFIILPAAFYTALVAPILILFLKTMFNVK